MWYVVQPGDSLQRIAQKTGASLESIIRSNAWPDGKLYIGHRLYIPEETRELVNYTVKPGETLEVIAQKFHTTKQAIMQKNHLDSDFVVAGQTLQIDAPAGVAASYIRPLVTYTVVDGDTLDSIAQKFNIGKQVIMHLNHLTSETVTPGQQLQIDTRIKIPYSNTRPLTTYKVEVGDTLDTIAQKFNISKAEIIQLNGLGSETLKAGQTLTLNIEPRDSLSRFPEDSGTEPTPASEVYRQEINSVYDRGLRTNITIWKASKDENGTYFFVSKMAVTAVGSPKAFHPNNELGLDFLNSAGNEGYWWDLVTNDHGVPVVQGGGDPAPGYYVSRTILSDCKKQETDPTRYVDAAVVPYIALPARHLTGAKIGDLCAVVNTGNSKIGYAIVADVGPDDSLGTGSIALAEELGIPSSPKIGGAEDGILYIVFAQSGENRCTVKTREQVIQQAKWLFDKWGGIHKVHALFGKFPLSYKQLHAEQATAH
ncbi:hypothetical protein PM3016_1651 [Paenibacillus mucilaginosus 3016]|uniref:LysM domain-containing protein n=2 Tax=Paenibacillus mucilaginosus TaxID=61624 RepID=H6NCF6_9BACL|nr:LysM peptidoglycan-binding domain-containing protein [Paenibacillus mucilaginosus]AFC28569.1 hypothetical protein PM3016_1651 [Paenibacillus mucilaginosus 3016]AFH60734.1 hypothetical protein B2K_08380 [Paenibacillus mucilaginosus K02]WFA17354.1 LysM peptidoglycan-binding domain-containing protein [Paenibacillus mucilaginosus]